MELEKGNLVLMKKLEELDKDELDEMEDEEEKKNYEKRFAGKWFTIHRVVKTKKGITLYELEEDIDINSSNISDFGLWILELMGGFKPEKAHGFSDKFFKETDDEKESTSICKELKDTVGYMLSNDYKERFIAEYEQLRIRRDKLQKMYDNWDNLTFEPVCPKKTYKMQLLIMNGYLEILKERAEKENIKLC